MKDLAPLQITTSEMILAELLNSAAHNVHVRSAAAEMVETLRADSSLTVIPQTSEQFQGALRLYVQGRDKEWSLTDCSSFLIMEERGIHAALTHDPHFAQAGFEALLR